MTSWSKTRRRTTGPAFTTIRTPGRVFADSLFRSVLLSQAARIALRDGHLEGGADVVHCHDNHTGLLPAYLIDDEGPPSVYTIHNLAYQGVYPGVRVRGHRPGADTRFFGHSAFEYYGDLSLMKSGLLHANAVTTVSPNYAAEIVRPEHGQGLDGVLRLLGDKLTGILNGIDMDGLGSGDGPRAARQLHRRRSRRARRPASACCARSAASRSGPASRSSAWCRA